MRRATFPPIREGLPICGLLLIAAAVFLCGINWGLPSRAADPFLFGNRKPWTGRQIVYLAGGWDENPDLGADVALHPLNHRDQPQVVNDSYAQKARIVRRYRLASYQPDEISTLRALAGMNPRKGRLDPRLYQYGGLWIYPVGGMLGISSKLGFIQLRPDVAWYMDHPEAFGRFYIVARLYAALWALAGVLAVYLLIRRVTGGRVWPAVGALCYILLPVVVNMAHEAKPHLPGAVLMLWAIWMGARYVETGRRRDALGAGALCGAAFGMVLSSLPIFCILPIMALLRRGKPRDKWMICGLAVLLGVAVYCLTNPYIPINLLHNRKVLHSSFANNRAMYHPRLSANAIVTTGWLLGAGTSPVLAILGAVGALALGARAIGKRADHSPAEVRRRAAGLLLAAPALGVLAQCLLVATGKPGEFGRFMLLADIFLAFEAVVATATFVPRASGRAIVAVVMVVSTGVAGLLYVRGFVRDSRPVTGRILEARRLRALNEVGFDTLAIFAEPAPYCMPPVDLFRWEMTLLPKGSAPGDGMKLAEVSIQSADAPSPTPISWADKPFDLRVRVQPLSPSPK